MKQYQENAIEELKNKREAQKEETATRLDGLNFLFEKALKDISYFKNQNDKTQEKKDTTIENNQANTNEKKGVYDEKNSNVESKKDNFSYHLVDVPGLTTEINTEERKTELKGRFNQAKLPELKEKKVYPNDSYKDKTLDELRKVTRNWASVGTSRELVFIKVDEDSKEVVSFFLRYNQEELKPESKSELMMDEFEIVKKQNPQTFFETRDQVWLKELEALCKHAPTYLNRMPDAINRIQKVLNSSRLSDAEKIEAIKGMKLSTTQNGSLKVMFRAFKEDDLQGFNEEKEKMRNAYYNKAINFDL